jgi:hypothetical protein
VRKLGEFCGSIGSCFVKAMGEGVMTGALSGPAKTVDRESCAGSELNF